MINQEKAIFKLGGNFIAFMLALVPSPSKGDLAYLVEGNLLFSFSSGYKIKSGACLKYFVVSLWVSQETDFSTVASFSIGLLSVVSVTHGQLQSKNTKWENSQNKQISIKLHTILSSVLKSHVIPLQKMNCSFVY